MKSFSIVSTFLFACVFALIQVWSVPVSAQVIENNQVNPAFSHNSVYDDFSKWYNELYTQYAKKFGTRDVQSPAQSPAQFPPFPPFPPPPTFPPFPPFPPSQGFPGRPSFPPPPTFPPFPPFPPPPTFPPFPPFPPGRG